MPNVEHVGISRRIMNEEERTRLSAIVERIKPEGYGLIIRTASEDSPEEDLKKDLSNSSCCSGKTSSGKKTVCLPADCCYSDLDLVIRSIRDLMSQDVERLVIDSREEYDPGDRVCEDLFSQAAQQDRTL